MEIELAKTKSTSSFFNINTPFFNIGTRFVAESQNDVYCLKAATIYGAPGQFCDERPLMMRLHLVEYTAM